MKTPAPVVFVAVLASLLGIVSGCSNPGLALRDTQSEFNRRANVDRLKERTDYVNSNYQMQLKTGRAQNEKEARALAALDYERLRHRGSLETE